MANYKTSRTEEDILRELTALLRELKDPRIDPLLTIVRVELSNDMSNCKVYVSSLSGIETAKNLLHRSGQCDRIPAARTVSSPQAAEISGSALHCRPFH